MSAAVETMAYHGEVPWHGEGRTISDPYNLETTFAESGLDWRVGTVPLFREGGERIPYNGLVRETDGYLLDVVGKNWTPLQNESMFEWFRPWLESRQVQRETAGSLSHGRRVWVLARLSGIGEGEVMSGDKVVPYLLLANGHQRNFAVRAGFTPIRVVCRNTLYAS